MTTKTEVLNKSIHMDRQYIGMRFGALLVIDTCEVNLGKDKALMTVCDCGALKKVRIYNLTRSERATRSCGCKNLHSKSHGMSGTPTYSSWQAMLNRCLDPRHDNYRNYGGRGISVCPEWADSFKNFFDDMGIRPDDCTLDRLDSDDNYYKDNCVWATSHQQALGRSTTHILTLNGETRSATEWSVLAGHSRMRVTKLMREKGVSITDAVYNNASIEFVKKYPPQNV